MLWSDTLRQRVIELGDKRALGIYKWSEVADIIAEEFDPAPSLRTIQRWYADYIKTLNNIQELDELQRKKYQLMDIERERRNSVRHDARFEALLNVLEEGLKDFERYPIKTNIRPTGNNYMVAVVSDWHLGAKYENYLGEYNYEILVDRVSQFADEVIARAKLEGVQEILILNLNDLIEGNIHVSTRIQAEFDAVQQTIKAGELLHQFITRVANETGCKIKVGSVLDNHSRINKNFKDHIEKESFGKLVEYITRLLNTHPNVKFIGNSIDDNIGFTQFGGRETAWVHGHLDKPKDVMDDLQNLIGINLDRVYIAHRHHVMLLDDVVQVGSLKGTDEYAFNKRLLEGPSQTIEVFNEYTSTITNVYF